MMFHLLHYLQCKYYYLKINKSEKEMDESTKGKFEITSKQAFSLLSLCKSNRFDFPYYRLFEWKAIKKQ